MNKTLVVVSSNRDMCQETRDSIDALRAQGAGLIHQRGTSDVALARNVALSMTVSAFAKFPERDVALMVDDDMVFSVDDATRVVAHARRCGVPASAIYGNTSGRVAAKRWTENSSRAAVYGHPYHYALRGWLVGLGFLAIPRAVLLRLAEECPRFDFRDTPTWAFTSTGVVGSEALVWESEDYALCKRLGGVALLPVEVGHMKRVPIYASAEAIQRIGFDSDLLGTDGAGKIAQ